MIRIMKVIISLFVLSLTLAVLAPMAQAQNDMFKDVPIAHWAYEDIKVLKADGLLTGYPGEVFLGNHPMTRYEFATATRAMYENLIKKIGEVNSLSLRIKALETTSTGNSVTAELTALKEQLAEMALLKDDIARLNKLAEEFEKELASLGVSVPELTARTTELERLVKKLLERPQPIDIHGDLFFGARAGHGSGDNIGIDLNGIAFGVDTKTLEPTTNPIHDLHIVHELGMNVKGDFGNGVTANAEFIVSNYLNYLGSATQPFNFGSSGTYIGFTPPGGVRIEDVEDVAIYSANVGFAIGTHGGVNAQLGRLGYQVSPYTFRRVDPDWYFDVPRYDNGNIYFDGAKLGFDWGAVKLDMFGGKNNNISATNTENYQRITAGQFPNSYYVDGLAKASTRFFEPGSNRPTGLQDGVLEVDTTLGAALKVGLTSSANLGLTYIVLDGVPLFGDGYGMPFNRVAIMGGNVNAQILPSLSVKAEYAQTDVLLNNRNIVSSNNWAADGGLRYNSGDTFHIGAGYKEIRPLFAAPGYWGRIGFWYNPVDIKGFTADAHYKFNDDFMLSASGEFYQGTGQNKSGTTLVGFSTKDKITRLLVDGTYHLNSAWSLSAGWEGVMWDLKNNNATEFTGGKPRENYYTVGMGYQLGNDALLKIMYQVVDYDSKGVSRFNAPGSLEDNASGGLLVTQVTVKF